MTDNNEVSLDQKVREVVIPLCTAMVRDAVPATKSGATCFVPKYQLESLAAILGDLDAIAERLARVEGLEADRVKLIEALEIADGIIQYCSGDAWERECTADDRAKFAGIYDEFFPASAPTLPIWPTSTQVRATYGFVACGHCGRKVSGHPDAIKQHCDALHPTLPPIAGEVSE